MPLLSDRSQPARLSRAGGLRLACGLLLVGSGVIWLSLQEPRGQRRTLAGVAEVELTGATYGTLHEHWDGNFWQRLGFQYFGLRDLRLNTPPTAHGVDPSPYRELTTASNTLALWFRTRFIGSHQSGFWSAATLDSHGCVVPTSSESWSMRLPGQDPDGNGPLTRSVPLELTVFPRREPSFRFAVQEMLQPDSRRLELRIANPAPLNLNQWVAQPCPVSASAGDTRFVLRSLKHLHEPGSLSRSEAVFECFERGKRVTTWRPDRISLSDATGNVLDSRHDAGAPDRRVLQSDAVRIVLESKRDVGEPDRFVFETLCRFESAWKLRVRFVRSEPEVTSPDFTWSPPVMPAPAWGAYADTKDAATFSDLHLRLTRVVGGGKVQFPGGSGEYGWPAAEIKATGPPGKYQLSLLRPKLKSGPSSRLSPWQRSRILDSDVFTPSDIADATFPLGEGPLPQRRLRLTFAVYRTLSSLPGKAVLYEGRRPRPRRTGVA